MKLLSFLGFGKIGPFNKISKILSAGKMYEETDDTFLYFAYGSNLLKNRIRINNASAEFLGVGRLENHRLDFIKYSEHWRGSSATIVPHEGSYVWGAIWRLHVYDMPALDKYREKCNEVSSSLKQRAQLLGEFVAEQMSGLTQERDCSMPSVKLHLHDLMTDLNSSVVGIGWVRCGGALERSVLYKTLADRLGIPCALYRASGAHAWCEVAVPDVDPDAPEEKFPAGLLRANYIVDLIVRPGRLLAVGSVEAARVCGPSCAARYTARDLPEVCRCKPQSEDSA